MSIKNEKKKNIQEIEYVLVSIRFPGLKSPIVPTNKHFREAQSFYTK